MFINAVLLIFSTEDVIFVSYVVNLGLILGAGRLIFILNACLVAEAAYSNTRGTVSSLFKVIQNCSEIAINLLIMNTYANNELVSMLGILGF